MSSLTFTITLYPNLLSVDEGKVAGGLTWDHAVALLSTHRRGSAKEDMPGWGPYDLVDPPAACHHKYNIKNYAHRCDSCVISLGMCVFDVDVGTAEQVNACEAELEKEGLTRLWYSSWSFSPDQERPSLRLVVPLARPVDGKVWPSFREHVLRRFRVPADVDKCKGRSHFYYLPSCSATSEVEPLVSVSITGKFLDPATVPVVEDVHLSPRQVVQMMAGWVPPEDPAGPVDLTPFHDRLETRARKAMRSPLPADRERAKVLRRLIAGEALANKGGRNATMASVVMSLCGLFPGSSTKELLAVVRDSLHAMQQAGSSLTEDTVQKQIQSGMRKMAESELQREQLAKAFHEFTAGIPTV